MKIIATASWLYCTLIRYPLLDRPSTLAGYCYAQATVGAGGTKAFFIALNA